jgi:hypothetical protein
MSACHIGNYVKKLKEQRKKIKMGRDPYTHLYPSFFLNVFGVIAYLAFTIIEGCNILFMEDDSLTTIPAINQAHLFIHWAISPIIADIQLKL